MPGYPLVILILLCEAELAYLARGVCLGLASTVLAFLGVCHARPAVAAVIVHADGARIMSEEAQLADAAASMMSEVEPKPLAGTDLGALLKQALRRSNDCA